MVRKKNALNTPSFDSTYELEPTVLGVVIVNDGQASSTGKAILSTGASFFLSMHGRGTASSDFYDVFGLGNQEKRAFFAPMRLSLYLSLREYLQSRFKVSTYAKGIAFAMPIDSFMGVAAYRLVNDVRYLKTSDGKKEKPKMEKSPYVAIWAVVNDGFTDIVMEAAKRAGARGGTILTAHGTGNKEIERFFGIAITPEKEIVMIIVKEEIKSPVMEAIYRDAGISTKGQGIVFAMPIADALGLSGEEGQ